MSRKIACVRIYEEGGYGWDYNEEALLSTITDFEEVDEDTFQLLKQAQYNTTPRFYIVELLDNTFIGKTVAEYKELARQWEVQRQEEERKRKERQAAAEAKRKQKQQEKKADRIAKLQAELAELQDGRE